MSRTTARVCVRLRIEGRVQGVGFRAFVELEARARAISGWVRNRRDGGVEAVIAGTGDQIDAMIGRCRDGPRGSRVDLLKVLQEDCPAMQGFEVRPTV